MLVVEIRSPVDETDAKIPFYARFGVGELLIVERDSAEVQLLRRAGGILAAVPADGAGWVRSNLNVSFRPAPINVLEVRLPDGTVEHC